MSYAYYFFVECFHCPILARLDKRIAGLKKELAELEEREQGKRSKCKNDRLKCKKWVDSMDLE